MAAEGHRVWSGEVGTASGLKAWRGACGGLSQSLPNLPTLQVPCHFQNTPKGLSSPLFTGVGTAAQSPEAVLGSASCLAQACAWWAGPSPGGGWDARWPGWLHLGRRPLGLHEEGTVQAEDPVVGFDCKEHLLLVLLHLGRAGPGSVLPGDPPTLHPRPLTWPLTPGPRPREASPDPSQDPPGTHAPFPLCRPTLYWKPFLLSSSRNCRCLCTVLGFRWVR